MTDHRPPLPDGPLLDEVGAALRAQRRIMVTGPLDALAVNQLSAQLMVFDGASGDDIELIVNSPGGPLADVMALLDVLQVMRAPVNTVCIGAAESTAAALVATGTGTRRAGARARFRLRSDEQHDTEGSATELARRAEDVTATVERYQKSLASATGRTVSEIEAEMAAGTTRDAAEAADFGLIDGLVGS